MCPRDFRGAAFTTAIMLLGIMGAVTPTPLAPGNSKYEEYVIEHEISTTMAKNSVLTYNAEFDHPRVGCQQCTTEELNYCQSSNLMNDHCCCDAGREELPFIPHTCYLGTKICRTVLRDCEEYTRLRYCCCDHFLRVKWMEKSSSTKLLPVPGSFVSLAAIICCYFKLLLI